MDSSRPIARRGKKTSAETDAKEGNRSNIAGVKRACHPKLCSEVAFSPCVTCSEQTHSADFDEPCDSDLSKKFSTKKVGFLEIDFGCKCDQSCSRAYNNRRRCSEFWEHIHQYIDKLTVS